MDALIACTGCARHVRASEPQCPFCGAERAPEHVALRPLPGRLGRAALFAFGAALAAAAPGCSESHETNDASMQMDAGGIAPAYGIAPVDATVAPAYGAAPGD